MSELSYTRWVEALSGNENADVRHFGLTGCWAFADVETPRPSSWLDFELCAAFRLGLVDFDASAAEPLGVISGIRMGMRLP